MLAAAQAARWSYDFELAARLVERALAVGAGFDAALLAAELAALRGRIGDAEAQLAELVDRAETDQQKAHVALARLNNHAFYSGAISEGLQIVEDVQRNVKDQEWKNEFDARRAGLLLASAGPRVAAEVFEPLLQQGDGAPVWAYQIAAPAYARLGRFSDALAAGSIGYRQAQSLSRPSEWYPWVHLFFRSRTLCMSGALLEGARLGKQEHETALESGSIEAQGWFAWALAGAYRDRGDIALSTRLAREAAVLFAELGRSLVQREALIDVASSLATAGRADDARAALMALDRIGLPASYLTGVDLLLARGSVDAAAGDLPMARRHYEEAADTGERIGDLVGAVHAVHGLARIGSLDGQLIQRLNALVAAVTGDYVKVYAVHVRGLLEQDVDCLQSASSLFEAAGARFLAAEVAADAGDAARTAGDPRRAAAAKFPSTSLLALCHGAALLGRPGRVARDVLTRAEQEAALLAVAGRTNRSIANQLCLSVRAVEGRLQRVYTKLGVSSREELAAKLTAASH